MQRHTACAVGSLSYSECNLWSDPDVFKMWKFASLVMSAPFNNHHCCFKCVSRDSGTNVHWRDNVLKCYSWHDLCDLPNSTKFVVKVWSLLNILLQKCDILFYFNVCSKDEHSRQCAWKIYEILQSNLDWLYCWKYNLLTLFFPRWLYLIFVS